MPSAIVTKCAWTTGYVMTVMPASGRPISGRRCGESPEEASAVLADAMVRHNVLKAQVAAPPEVMAHIHRICPGQRIR